MCRSIRIALLCALFACQAFASASLPAYQLKVGQQIQYEGKDNFKFDGGQFNNETSITLWVTRANPKGGWHVVARQSTVMKDDRFKGNEKPRVSYAWFDLSPDGTTHTDANLIYAFDASTVFPKLPASDSERAKWSSHDALTDTHTTFSAIKSEDAKLFKFYAIPERMYDTIYGMGMRLTYTLDQDKGLITSFDSDISQTYGFNGRGTGETKLKSVEMKPSDWMNKFASETDLAFQVTGGKADVDDADEKAITAYYTQNAAAAREALAKMTLLESKQILEDHLSQLPEMQKYAIEGAKTKAQVKSAPPADWTAKALDGRIYTLKGLRGKVVLLDYWYRGCGWCMRAMPQVKQLAEKYKDKNVVVLGMNTDQNVSDAQFVVDAMKLNYPVLQAKDLIDTYKINSFEFPTLVVMDQSGKVRAMHVGYSPTLQDDLSKIIDGLLK